MITLLVAGAAGAAAMYFLDPENGTRRWAVTRDRGLALLRRGADTAEGYGDYAADRARGLQHELGASGSVGQAGQEARLGGAPRADPEEQVGRMGEKDPAGARENVREAAPAPGFQEMNDRADDAKRGP